MALGEGVRYSVIAVVLRRHPSVAADTVQLLLRGRVTPLGVAENDDGEVLLSVTKREKCPSAREAAPPQRAEPLPFAPEGGTECST